MIIAWYCELRDDIILSDAHWEGDNQEGAPGRGEHELHLEYWIGCRQVPKIQKGIRDGRTWAETLNLKAATALEMVSIHRMMGKH